MTRTMMLIARAALIALRDNGSFAGSEVEMQVHDILHWLEDKIFKMGS